MIWRIILWGSLIWLPYLMYRVLGGEAKFTKNIAVGVTMPFEGREDAEVCQRLAKFKKELGIVCAVLTAAVVPCIFIRSVSLSMTLYLTWADVCIVLPYIPYLRCNRDLKRIKRSRGWAAERGDTRTVDLKAVQEPRGISAWCFVPAIALALLPLAFERGMWAIYAANAVGAAVCLACFRWAFRRRAELVDADTDLTNTLTRIRRRSWERIWLAAAYGLAFVSFAVWLSDGAPVRSVLGILLASAIVVIAVLRIELRTRNLQARLTESSGRDWYADEDDKWLGGVAYYDPHDTRTVVNCRVGSSTTVNLARPSGRVLAGMAALILLAMPFTGALIDAVTNRPTSLELTDTELVAYCGDKSAYRIERADIESAELLDELPEHLVRRVGTGAENLLKGDFSAAKYGRLKLCLDPNCPPFLLVECAGGEVYLIGSRTEGETEVIFGEIGA